MQFGYDEHRLRIKPSFSGQKAVCPLCNGTILGKCGEIYVWHWQHHQDRDCDPWKEHETDWHRKWKANFPSDWQEVIIENLGEKHIADIKTPSNIVIEFQNSSISSSTIRIRENFYKNMIWVVNAESFKQNFNLRSAVNSGLRDIDNNASYELLSVGNSYSEEILSISDEIEDNTKNLSYKFKIIKDKNENLTKLKDILTRSNDFADKLIDNCVQGKYNWDSQTSDISIKFDLTSKNELQEKLKNIKLAQDELSRNKQSLLDIMLLPDYLEDKKQFKIVQHEQIPLKSFHKAKAILKASRNTFFPEIITFKTEIEFKNHRFRKESYDFIVDPTDAIEYYNVKIKDGQKNIEILEKSLPIIKFKIREDIFKELEHKIKSLEIEIIQLNSSWDNLLKLNSQLKAKKDILCNNHDTDVAEFRRQVEKKRNNQRSKVMKEKKGCYDYWWKHERKSWRASKSTIFFDIGEKYLLEKISDGNFRKIVVSEFLEKYCMTQ
jgi:competence CoiA-like predicted nuclease